MSAILIGAVLGLLIFGGLRGLVVGAALGFAVAWGLRQLVRRGLGDVQAQFIESTFAVMGALCKADSVVTRDEIRAAEQLFDRLHLSVEQRAAAKAAFNRGKAPDFDLDSEVAKLAAVAGGRGPLLQLFLQVQCMAVAADGKLHPAEHAMLVRVARRLGLTEVDVARLEALLRAAAGDASAPGRPPGQRLADAYEALGVSPSASDVEIKRAYRRLMSQNHPDKLAGRGLPESLRDVAEERTREISAAYRLIKEARGQS
jgi:DnaJ like chaperone protein